MFNERAVCQSIIDSCCELAWPRERLCIQVLDDSTDKATRDLVDDKVAEWRERGVNVYALRRTNRSGYKAGAMKEGLDELADYDFVAIFDADFKPEPDFLTATVPYLIDNPEVGYVQARWTFANPNESYLTKAQEISLNYHVKCEQVSIVWKWGREREKREGVVAKKKKKSINIQPTLLFSLSQP